MSYFRDCAPLNLLVVSFVSSPTTEKLLRMKVSKNVPAVSVLDQAVNISFATPFLLFSCPGNTTGQH